MEVKKVSQEEIEKFIDGRDPQERIVNLSYKSQDDYITVFYRNEKDQKCSKKEPFYPFCWATYFACDRLCGGNREETKQLLSKYKIGVKKLSQTNTKGEIRHEFDDGYLFMFYAKVPMSYSRFLSFFKVAKNPVFSDRNDDERVAQKVRKQYLAVTPQEQYLISSGKRFFKGYDDYDQVLKMTIDLETTGLDKENDDIEQIGIRINRPFLNHQNGFEKIIPITGDTKEEKDLCRLWAIDQFFKVIYTFKPDIITAHNGEDFDWYIIINTCKRLKHPIEEFSSKYFGGDFIHKEERETILKLGGEMEKFHATIVPNIIVTDSLHAVRRAQALDSNMLKADLKYVTEYSKMKKPNRVYIPGEKISEVYNDNAERYAFCEKNGDWYRYDPSVNDVDNGEIYGGKKSFIPVHGFIRDGYVLKSGRYVGERYLLDDLFECDRVEHRYNTPNFLICKMLPVPYKKCTTMGTAGQWKALMLAWSYEQGIAIPMFRDSKTFTGGLSRLLKTGYVKGVIKLDYNSLYPSIILTWGISDPTDLMLAMLYFLEHVLTKRELYKGLKKVAGKKKDAATTEEDIRKYAYEESFNDKKQLPLKILGNSFFGSYGAPNVFPWGSIKCAEQTTCIGRMALRLMISHFKKLGYEPIVGDSFAEDTPVFIKYDETGYIDIKPICELIDEGKVEIDSLNREYDYSNKPYKVLCRSGWVKPYYIYRHRTGKDIYEVSDNEMKVEVTEDHSLFNSKQEKIKPSEITEETNLEYFNKPIVGDDFTIQATTIELMKYAHALINGEIDRVPISVLNCYNKKAQKDFYYTFMSHHREDIEYSKTCLAGIQFLKKSIS